MKTMDWVGSAGEMEWVTILKSLSVSGFGVYIMVRLDPPPVATAH